MGSRPGTLPRLRGDSRRLDGSWEMVTILVEGIRMNMTCSETGVRRCVPWLTAVALEFAKARRRHLWLASLGLLAFQFAWLVAGARNTVRHNPDFNGILYMLPQLNAIVLPLLCAIVVSTVIDVENRANMWKLMLTMEDASRVVAAKWVTCLVVLAAVVGVQTAGVGLVAHLLGFAQNLPGPATLVRYALCTFAVCAMLATIVQAVCLATANQFVPMVLGVSLCFLGLFVAYLPTVFSWFVPSAYFFVLGLVGGAFDASQHMSFWSAPFPVAGLVVCVVVTAVVFVASRRAFAAREL